MVAPSDKLPIRSDSQVLPASVEIQHIAPTPFFSDRGCHIRIAGIVRCLAELGAHNIVCTYHHGKEQADIATRRIGNIAGYTKTSAGPSPWKLWADLKLLFVSLAQYHQQRPAVLHAHLHEGVLIGFIVKTVFFWHRTPLIADLQGSLVGELDTYGFFNKYPVIKWPLAQLERLLLRVSTQVICSSSHALDKFESSFPETVGKLTLVEDGAESVGEIDAQRLTVLREKLSLPADKIVVVYSGALLESKGLMELMKLVAGARTMSDELHFLIVGYPTDALEAFLLEQNLQSLCTLTGRVDFAELNDYLSLADIAIDPKNSNAGEGSGKTLNYLANSLPVVAFDTLNNKRFLGEHVELAKTSEQASALLYDYVTDRQRRQQAATNSLIQFKQYFSWNITQGQLHHVYQRVGQFIPTPNQSR